MPRRASLLRLRVWTLAFLTAAALGASANSQAQEFEKLLGEGDDLFGSTASTEPIVTAALTETAPGEAALSVQVQLPADSYTYSMNPGFGGATRIEVTPGSGLVPLEGNFTADHAPKSAFEPLFQQTLEKFFDKVVWTRKFRIAEGAQPEQVQLQGVLKYQVCDKMSCRPLEHPFQVALTSGVSETATAQASAAPGTLVAHPYRYSETPSRSAGKPEPLTLEFDLSPADARPGETVVLTVTAKLEDRWHVFALDQNPDMAGLPTVFQITALRGLQALDSSFEPNAPPETEQPLENITQRVHYRTISWSRRFRVLESGAAGYGLAANVRYQVCREGTCRLPLTVPFVLGLVDLQTDAIPAEVAAADNADPSAVAVDESAAEPVIEEEGDIRNGGFWLFILSAMGAGFAALLTPCVFPMIPITVSFFLKQSEKEHHRPVSMALIYCAGIMVTFTVLGLLMAAVFGATQLNAFANNPWLNLGISGVLIFFGMNLLGLFEIRMPSWLLTWSAGKEGKGGVIGVLFMSLTFTLVSFTCTFAFAGLLLVWAAQGEYYWPIIGMLAFSGAFSLPFFFLALFPSFLQKLPKSGGWMNTVKVTMGMIELGAAFKFLSVADLVMNPEPMMFDFALVMSAWIVIAACAGFYLLGMFRLAHDTPSESISVFRFMAALTFLGFAAYLTVGLFAKEKPRGKLWDQILAFAPPQFSEGGVNELGPYLEHEGLKFALDVDRAFEVADKNAQPLFLDFTGVNCVNCRLMELKMNEPQNRERLEKFLLVQLYQDNVPQVTDRNEVERLLATNRKLQEEWFGDVTLPSYAVVAPGGRQILATFKGLETEKGAFARFLDQGLAKWQEHAAKEKLRFAER